MLIYKDIITQHGKFPYNPQLHDYITILYCYTGTVPYDGVPRNETVPVNLGITVTYTLMTAVGIAFAFMCLVFNIAFRNTR